MMRDSRRHIFFGFLALIWLTAIISLYYVWHKPFTPDIAAPFARALGQVAASLAIVSIAGGLGRRLSGSNIPGLAEAALHITLGCGIMSLVVLFIGSSLGMNSWYAWTLLVGFGIALRKDIRLCWQALHELKQIWSESQPLGKWLAVGLILIGLTTLLTALAPPLKYDALVYHIALPRFYQLTGRIEYAPWLMFWGMPQTGEMLYTWAIHLAGVETTAILGWMLGIVAVGGLVGHISRRFGALFAWVGAAALTAGFTYASSLAWAYVDWLLVLAGVGTLVSLDHWITDRRPRRLLLVGILAGIALGSKYTGGILLVAVIVVVIADHFRRKARLNHLFANLSILVAAALLVTMPWWIKNLWATGNPFYPFFFPAGAMDSTRLSFYNIAVWGDWKDTLLMPIMASVTGVEGTSGYNASIGPLLLGLAVCAILGWSGKTPDEKGALRIATIVTLTGIVLWVFAARLSGLLVQSRLYAAIFPALAVLAAAGYKSMTMIQAGSIRLGRVVGVLVLMVYALAVVEIGRYTLAQGAPQLVLGLKNPEAYLEENLGWYARAMQDIRSLPGGSKVLMLWEPRSFYCLPHCVPDEIIDRWKHDVTLWRTPQAILNSWLSSGYSHLLVYRLGADFVRSNDARYAPLDWQVLEQLLSSLSPPVAEFGPAYSLYGLK